MASGGASTEPATEILRTGREVVLRTRKLRLEVVGGASAGQGADFSGVQLRIGSGAGCDLVLADPAVSRHHLTIRLDAGGIRVTDAGSRNGTQVDGLRVVEAFARSGSLLTLGQSVVRVSLLDDVVQLPVSARTSFGGLIGESLAMRWAFTLLERFAPMDDTVLVEAETGTGKELAAEAIHEESPRSAGPFVIFDCSAVSASLVESELFGHARGAFTGAVADRKGAFESADGGTLFIDEIGELPLDLQPKLLRALERKEVRRVGSQTALRLDVRVVAATNRNLAEEVGRGTFREDLYYRLAVLRMTLPPLRERTEDIPLLAAHFARRHLQQGKPAQLSPQAIASLGGRSWPGNVRELRNAVSRLVSLGSVEAPQPPTSARGSLGDIDLGVPLMEARDRLVADFEERYLREALRVGDGSVVRAAEVAGVNRKFLQRALKRYRLRDP
jgi:DNA-binding NtrC family response regulator